MTIQVRKVSLRHRGGTKEYHLLCVVNDSIGHGIVVNRWGKTGAWGQMKTERDDGKKSFNSFLAKLQEKEARGYSIYKDEANSYDTNEAAKSAIGMAYWPQLGAANILHVMPGIDTSGVREAEPVTWKEENGKFVPDDKPKHSMPSPEEELAEKKANPNWGLF
jgi:predicted DNA-binding WGR domain protein